MACSKWDYKILFYFKFFSAIFKWNKLNCAILTPFTIYCSSVQRLAHGPHPACYESSCGPQCPTRKETIISLDSATISARQWQFEFHKNSTYKREINRSRCSRNHQTNLPILFIEKLSIF